MSKSQLRMGRVHSTPGPDFYEISVRLPIAPDGSRRVVTITVPLARLADALTNRQVICEFRDQTFAKIEPKPGRK